MSISGTIGIIGAWWSQITFLVRISYLIIIPWWTNHACSAVMSCFNWTLNVWWETMRLIIIVCTAHIWVELTRPRYTTACWRLTYFHSWTECVFQENASLISNNSRIVWRITLLSSIRIWTHLLRSILVTIILTMLLLSLKMMLSNSFPIWMLLGASCSWVKEIVNALKGSVSLTCNLATSLV